ncbi:MAG TPA: acyltransferase [Bryobacteraceae bacterium]|jgi:acetyltransferase-like isoleucine patch superfamily enzyme|nr:acyltransferase [Bryobacteraceae bacterium]
MNEFTITNGQTPGAVPQSGTPREVIATFGRRTDRQDPAFERELALSLREAHSRQELLDLLTRFAAGENAFDQRMRRILLSAVCRSTGNDLQVGPNIVLKHPETMEFGDSVFLGAQCMIQGRFDGTCRIGNHVWIGPQAYFDARDLVIEDYVGWGPGAKVLGSAHTGMPITDPIIRTGLVIKPVRVGFGADVGMNASILPGVRVGAHAIVGAGAVVTQDVPEYAIVAGVPARFLRDRREEKHP